MQMQQMQAMADMTTKAIATAVGACTTLLIGACSRSDEARAALGFVSIGAIVIAAVGVAAAWTAPATVGRRVP